MFFDKFLPESVNPKLIYKLVALQIFILVLSNFLVTIKFDWLGIPLRYSAFTYPFILVLTDLTTRLIGQSTARSAVAMAFIPAIILTIIVDLATGAPVSTAVRIGVAGGLAYFISTMLDVNVFQYFRDRFQAWFVAPAISAVIIITIDTYMFFAMAFHAGADEFMAYNWHIVATSHIVSKWLMSLAVILPAYGLLLAYLKNKIAVK